MTEIRKSIINLIEPYMDKTAERWCYIQLWDWLAYVYKRVWDIILTQWIWNMHIGDIESSPEYKIIWHYDITAVFKYMQEKLFKSMNNFDITNWKIYFWENDWAYSIPNKPLHLYSEQEEKELLDLLTIN